MVQQPGPTTIRRLRYRPCMTPDRTIAETAHELPAAVAAALAATEPDPGTRLTTVAARIPFSSIAWGDPEARPLVLLHGVSASARVWWRVGPALAATGRRVVAVDLPGHGLTGHWTGHHRFRDNAADVAEWIRAMALDVPEVQVIGHSWGAMTAAALPVAGIRPATLVLLDPPALPHAVISAMASDPSEVTYQDVEAAVAAVTQANPTWPAGDVEAKAEALIQLDIEAARAVLLDNGDFDGGLADLSDPAAAGIPVWLVRGDPAAGGLIPDAVVPRFAALIGPSHIVTLAGAPHSPQRTDPEATTAVLLRALG
jgi:pimeloyl-ACP methyl ester carboxylesterase